MSDPQKGSQRFGRWAKVGRVFLPKKRDTLDDMVQAAKEQERRKEIASRLNVTRQVKHGYERPKSVFSTEKPHKAKARARRRVTNKIARESRRRNWQGKRKLYR